MCLMTVISLAMASDGIDFPPLHIREEMAAGFVYNIRRLDVLNGLIFKEEVPEDIVLLSSVNSLGFQYGTILSIPSI